MPARVARCRWYRVANSCSWVGKGQGDKSIKSTQCYLASMQTLFGGSGNKKEARDEERVSG
jgi:hypothetical protein